MRGMLSHHFIDSSSALLRQQSLILPAPNHLEWEFRCVYNIWVCIPLQPPGCTPCRDTTLLILLSSFLSIYSLLQKSLKYTTLVDLQFVCVKHLELSNQRPQVGTNPSLPPCCTGAFVLEIPSRVPRKLVKVCLFLKPSGSVQHHSISAVRGYLRG